MTVKAGGINIWAVVVGAVAYWMLGAAWFTTMQQPWLTSIGKTLEQVQKEGVNAGLAYGFAFLCNLIIAYVIGWVTVATGDQTLARGATIGAVLWVGLVATTIGTAFIFEARSFAGFWLTAGYPLVGMLLMGAIVGAWRK